MRKTDCHRRRSAGLSAAECLAQAGVKTLSSSAWRARRRKFLMAGRGGLNLTHSEDFPRFLERYGEAMRTAYRRFWRDFGPEAIARMVRRVGAGNVCWLQRTRLPERMKGLATVAGMAEPPRWSRRFNYTCRHRFDWF